MNCLAGEGHEGRGTMIVNQIGLIRDLKEEAPQLVPAPVHFRLVAEPPLLLRGFRP